MPQWVLCGLSASVVTVAAELKWDLITCRLCRAAIKRNPTCIGLPADAFEKRREWV